MEALTERTATAGLGRSSLAGAVATRDDDRVWNYPRRWQIWFPEQLIVELFAGTDCSWLGL
jgi:hypothetical protein